MRPTLDLANIEDLDDIAALLPYLEEAEARDLDFYLRSRAETVGPDLLEYARLAFRGTFDIARHHVAIARALKGVEDGSIKRLMIFAPPRHGKQLADETPILTPRGWTTHGELRPGDEVFHPAGGTTRVMAVSAPTPAQVRMEWVNGEVIWCNEAHDWPLFDRSYGEDRVIEAGWLAGESRRRKRRAVWTGGRANFQSHPTAPLEGNPQDLPVRPYTLGAWLGDGSTGKPCITGSQGDGEIIERVVADGYAVSTVCVHAGTGCLTTYFSNGPLRGGLIKAGVWGNKHIPEAYLVAPVADRLDLLAGLIDTDGHVDRRTGRVRIVTCSPVLASGIMDLIHTMGWRASLHTQAPVLSSSNIQGRKDVHYVGFNPSLPIPTVIPRKKTPRTVTQRAIGLRSADLDPASTRTGRCIQVAARDGLYLAGRSLIPTHNSTLATEIFPAWFLGRNPDKRVMIISYSDDLASGFSRAVRNQVGGEKWPWPDVRLASDRWAADDWQIADRLGGCRAAGVQGAIIGKGTDLLVLDDPIKSREEADSPTARARLFSRYQNDIYSRLEPGAAIILMLQRWHKADLAGTLLDIASEDARADQWVVLDMPARALAGDMLGRAEGEALWPQRKSAEELKSTEVNVGPRAWSANWQQRPTTQEGMYFKRDHFTWRWRDERELRIDRVVQVVDSAFKEGVSTSRSAIVTWVEGFLDGRPFCGPIHAWAERVEYPSLIQKLKELNESMTTKLQRAVPLYIEDKASGTSAIQTLRSETRIAVVPYQPPSGSSKESRAESATHFFSARRVALPLFAAWIEEWVEEHADYPTAKTNDLVDTTGMALDIFYGLANAPVENPIPEGVRTEDWLDSASMRAFDKEGEDAEPAEDSSGLFVI